nr:PHP domain-containing protein [Melghirimyces thermohalophilus]
MDLLDLHVHTTASDGMFSPAAVVEMAKEKNLYGIAITDHDTVDGVKEAMARGKELGIQVVPGVEISTVAHGKDIHMLGYFVDRTDEAFRLRLQEQREARQRRNELLLEKLNSLGISITMEEVRAKKKDGKTNVGRPHFAEVLVEKGVVQSMNEAFDRYLGKDGAAYVITPRIHPEEAIHVIREAGGVPVLAHPGLYGEDELVLHLAQQGLAGIEVNHPDHDDEMRARYREMARRFQLPTTGGSDFHGERHGSMYHAPLGTCVTDRETVERLSVSPSE